MRIILILFFFVTAFPVQARMYQWVESGDGTTQLSGKPPAWYRSGEGGPRVFVFDKGRLIDDTAVGVSDEVRQRMRQEAFVLVEEDRQEAREKIVRAEAMKQKRKLDNARKTVEDEIVKDEKVEDDLVDDIITDTLLLDKKQENKQTDMDNLKNKKLDELRALIADWEKSQTESAKQALK